jgi:hypothetical protein
MQINGISQVPHRSHCDEHDAGCAMVGSSKQGWWCWLDGELLFFEEQSMRFRDVKACYLCH